MDPSTEQHNSIPTSSSGGGSSAFGSAASASAASTSASVTTANTANANSAASASVGTAALPHRQWKLVSPVGKKAQCWEIYQLYCSQTHPEKNGKARCEICGKDYSYLKGTGGLSNHYDNHIKKGETSKEVAEAHHHANNKKRKFIDRLGGGAFFKKKEEDIATTNEEFFHSTVAWVVDENLPFHVVEKKAFRRMIETANSNLPVFSKKNIRDEVERLVGVCHDAVKHELKGKFFSLTTDHWTTTSNNASCNEAYSCLTAHYIEDGVMKHAVLTFEVFKASATRERLGKDFCNKFDEYGFDLNYVVAVTTDAVTGNVNDFGRYLNDKGVIHLYCVDQNLQLTVNLAFEQKTTLDLVEKTILEPLALAQRSLEAEKNVTVSLIPYALWKTRSTLHKSVNDANLSGSARCLAKVLLRDFVERRYGDGMQVFYPDVVTGTDNRYISLHPIVLAATAVDPRFKRLRPFVPAAEDQAVWDYVKELMITWATGNMDKTAHATTDDAADDCADDVEADFFGDFLMANAYQHDHGDHNIDDPEAMCEAELVRYKRLHPIGWKEDPLQYWYHHRKEYPILYAVASQLLSIQATRAPSERLWSVAAKILNKERDRLHSEVVGNLANLMFLKENGHLLKEHYATLRGKEIILPNVYTDPREIEEALAALELDED
uniref:BED-type domain-containing protein n=1 Tax=Grammatophora oceanica TaxID=210454 RepID=A0A7S1VWA5_9STRA|mmetsp:Transcript_9635/g.14154  ORF Transcript_9635/g.14154 Transcript_9635/m.14154 type:complete len:663 (+) Transcript_9635:32-2020(+)